MQAQTQVRAQVRQELLDKIDGLQLSERQTRLRDRYFDSLPTACSERLALAMQGWRETEGQPIDLRKARQLQRVLDGIPVIINEYESIAGSPTKYFRGAYPYVDWDAQYIKDPEVMREEEGSTVITFGSPTAKGTISEDDKRILREAVAYFRGRSPAELERQALQDMWGSWYEDAMQVKATTPRYDYAPPLPSNPDWAKVVRHGLRSIVEEARQRLQGLADAGVDDPEKIYFYQASIIACEAAIAYAHRYARLARQMAAEEQTAERRRDLELIAEMCEWVPENPARSMREAAQSVRLVFLAALMEQARHGPALGRLDQYLYPYFIADLDAGRITIEEAGEIVAETITFAARMEQVSEASLKRTGQNTQLVHITLAGVDSEGDDASNELTYLIVHVLGLLAYAEPHATIRWSPKTPHWLLLKGLQTNRKVNGVPMYVNDEHVINSLVKRGAALPAARDWKMHGCSQPECDPMGYIKPMQINTALCLDLALHNGVASMSGKRLGTVTGDPRSFQTFDQVVHAFEAQAKFVYQRLLTMQRVMHRVEALNWRMPLQSSLTYGCLENGKDILVGGTGAYPIWHQKDRAIVDVGDSLMAVKHLCFNGASKPVNLAALMDALDSDFQGEEGEEIRQACLRAPKFGNDIDEADLMVRSVGKFTAQCIRDEKNAFGYPYSVQRNGLAWHYDAGKGVGALPNGHKAGEPLNDATSPMRGMDKKGPTAVCNSVLRADFSDALVAILNIRFPLSLSMNQETMEKIARFMELFLRNGGTHIQYNFLDAGILRDAQKHPEKYRDLVVRVAGYSAYFINLTPEVQEEIIARTEHCL